MQRVHFVGFSGSGPTWLNNLGAARLLTRGTKFIPTPGKLDRTDCESAFDRFARSCHFRLYFGDKEMSDHTARFRVANPTFMLPANVMQSPQHKELTDQLATLRSGLVDSYQCASQHVAVSSKFRTNLSMSERRLVQRIRNDVNILIKPADKNLGLCVISRDWYIQEGRRQLASVSYKPILSFDIGDTLKLLDHFLVKHQYSLDPLELKWLQHQRNTVNHKLPCFYLLPKLHKNPVVGRPIVASSAWVFSPLSQWISYHLNPVVQSMDTVLVSTAAVVTELQSIALPTDTDVWLVSADVSDMYNNIPVSQAIVAVGCVVRRRFPLKLAEALVDAISLVLHNNYFVFDDAVYHQVNGIAMGTSCAPVIAQLFVAILEESFRASLHSRWPLLYKRYIDDAFIIFIGLRHELDTWLSQLQDMHQNLNWSFTVSKKAVAFLDLNIWIDQHSKQLGYSMHSKALNAFQYIPRYSFHPPHMARGWILTELYRIRRNSSTEIARLHACKHFYRRLRRRGHTVGFLNQVFDYESAGQSKDTSTQALPFLVLPYNRASSIWPYRQLIHDWHSDISRDFFKSAPRVAFSTTQSLGQRLVRARLPAEDIEIDLSD